jgi:hypothetical protein
LVHCKAIGYMVIAKQVLVNISSSNKHSQNYYCTVSSDVKMDSHCPQGTHSKGQRPKETDHDRVVLAKTWDYIARILRKGTDTSHSSELLLRQIPQ